MNADDLGHRLRRIEALLDRVAPPAADDPPTGELGPVVLTRLQALVERVHRMATDVSARSGAPEWDAADRLSARLLLEHLAAAVRDCRRVAAGADDRLRRVEEAIRDADRRLDARHRGPA